MTRNQNAEVDDGGPPGSDEGWENGIMSHLTVRVSLNVRGYAYANDEGIGFRWRMGEWTG
jgi:hypothetical protein